MKTILGVTQPKLFTLSKQVDRQCCGSGIELYFQSSESIAIDGTGSFQNPITSYAKLSRVEGNALILNPDGLFVNSIAAITSQDSETIDFTGDGTEDSPLIANVKISLDVGNIIEERVDGLFATAPDQVNADWNATAGAALILNKPTLSIVATTGDYVDLINKPVLAIVATSGSYNDLSDKPTIITPVNADWNSNAGLSQILNKPVLAIVATSGSYNDLSDKPSIPAAQVNSDWNATSGVAQILNKPNVILNQTTQQASSNAHLSGYFASTASKFGGGFPTGLYALEVVALPSSLNVAANFDGRIQADAGVNPDDVVIMSQISGLGGNIYNIDGTLTESRTVSGGDNSISFSGVNTFLISPTTGGSFLIGNGGSSTVINMSDGVGSYILMQGGIFEAGSSSDILFAGGSNPLNVINFGLDALILSLNAVGSGNPVGNFGGRVRGSDAINADEFITKAQLDNSPNIYNSDGVLTSMRTISGGTDNSLIFSFIDGTANGTMITSSYALGFSSTAFTGSGSGSSIANDQFGVTLGATNGPGFDFITYITPNQFRISENGFNNRFIVNSDFANIVLPDYNDIDNNKVLGTDASGKLILKEGAYYEEGTWVPSGTDAVWLVDESTSVCKYTRIGNTITTSCSISIEKVSNAPGGNGITINGLFVPVGMTTVSKFIGRWDAANNIAGFTDTYDFEIQNSSSTPTITLISSNFFSGGTIGDIITVEFTATYMIENLP